MREPRQTYGEAEAKALETLARIGRSASCKEAVARLRYDITNVTRVQDKLVKSYDRANNVITAGHDYHGTSLETITRQATRRASGYLAAARTTRMIVKRC
jgi:hypothetical protein